MRLRLREIIFILICLGVLVFGAILLIYADQTPAPGILMVGIALVALISRYGRNRHSGRVVPVTDEEDEGPPGQWDMEIYEQQAERRRRGDSDI